MQMEIAVSVARVVFIISQFSNTKQNLIADNIKTYMLQKGPVNLAGGR